MIRILGNYAKPTLWYLSCISNSKFRFFTFFRFLLCHAPFYIWRLFLIGFVFFLNLYFVSFLLMILFTLYISNVLLQLCLVPSIPFLSEELTFIPLCVIAFNCNLTVGLMSNLLIFLSFLKHVSIYSQSQVRKLIHLV